VRERGNSAVGEGREELGEEERKGVPDFIGRGRERKRRPGVLHGHQWRRRFLHDASMEGVIGGRETDAMKVHQRTGRTVVRGNGAGHRSGVAGGS
jgi:hypothetical protein